MEPTPIVNKIISQPFVISGCIIKNGDQFLLVQEARKERGKWNQPAGWLDFGEKIIDGAKREAKEETGLEIKITGLLGIYSLIKHQDGKIYHAVKFIFAAEALTNDIKFDPEELIAVKWFSLDEIKKLKAERILRDHDIINEIQDYLDGKIYPTEIVDKYYEQV
ncbi:MAG: NUDIX domain-containing protein [Patescibacteria group bacterium]|jgi:ADP-ribose pyrophosphatase YjhB (NUDIX family)|nr:NUDIX domain-containing protein [Patescibacteria group bacterium]